MLLEHAGRLARSQGKRQLGIIPANNGTDVFAAPL
jgi:hypothetical protein